MDMVYISNMDQVMAVLQRIAKALENMDKNEKELLAAMQTPVMLGPVFNEPSGNEPLM